MGAPSGLTGGACHSTAPLIWTRASCRSVHFCSHCIINCFTCGERQLDASYVASPMESSHCMHCFCHQQYLVSIPVTVLVPCTTDAKKGGEETRKVCYRQNPDIEKNIELQSSTALVECVMADKAMPATSAASSQQACSLGTSTTVLITLRNSCPKFNALKVVINTATACFSHDPSHLSVPLGPMAYLHVCFICVFT